METNKSIDFLHQEKSIESPSNTHMKYMDDSMQELEFNKNNMVNNSNSLENSANFKDSYMNNTQLSDKEQEANESKNLVLPLIQSLNLNENLQESINESSILLQPSHINNSKFYRNQSVKFEKSTIKDINAVNVSPSETTFATRNIANKINDRRKSMISQDKEIQKK